MVEAVLKKQKCDALRIKPAASEHIAFLHSGIKCAALTNVLFDTI